MSALKKAEMGAETHTHNKPGWLWGTHWRSLERMTPEIEVKRLYFVNFWGTFGKSSEVWLCAVNGNPQGGLAKKLW